MARYDHGRAYRARDPFTRWYPGAFLAGAPLYGWGGAGGGPWGWAPAVPFGYGGYPPAFGIPRRRPEESPAYGRGGDAAARRYARSRGYDAGYAFPPRPERGPVRGPRYDRGFRGRW